MSAPRSAFVWQWVHDQIYAGVVAAGYDDLNAAHEGLWPCADPDGLRPSQLADRAGITKQSVNDLLGHLERHGFLGSVPDSKDGRARVIRLTSKGRRLEKTIYAEAGGEGAGYRRDPGAATLRPAAQLP